MSFARHPVWDDSGTQHVQGRGEEGRRTRDEDLAPLPNENPVDPPEINIYM